MMVGFLLMYLKDLAIVLASLDKASSSSAFNFAISASLCLKIIFLKYRKCNYIWGQFLMSWYLARMGPTISTPKGAKYFSKLRNTQLEQLRKTIPSGFRHQFKENLTSLKIRP